jgi:hypothetical protein
VSDNLGAEVNSDLAEFATNNVIKAMGQTTLSIGRFDYCCDAFFLAFAEIHPDFVPVFRKEYKMGAPFNNNPRRTDWIILALKWFKSKINTQVNFVENLDAFEKMSNILWDDRKNIQHSYLIKIEMSNPVTLIFRKVKKTPNTKSTAFSIEDYKYEFSRINQICENAEELADFILSAGVECGIPNFEEYLNA